MRASIKNYMDALQKQREERGEDGGFSLIELIVVVVILGILAAIAIPIFLNIQQQAKDNALDAITANAATQAAASLAQKPTVTPTFANLTAGTSPAVSLTIAVGPTAPVGSTLGTDTFCVTGTQTGSATSTSGPGC